MEEAIVTLKDQILRSYRKEDISKQSCMELMNVLGELEVKYHQFRLDQLEVSGRG